MIRPAGRQFRNARNGVIDNGAVPHGGAEHLVATTGERINERLQALARDEQSCLVDWELVHDLHSTKLSAT